jgi:hypothetical protein
MIVLPSETVEEGCSFRNIAASVLNRWISRWKRSFDYSGFGRTKKLKNVVGQKFGAASSKVVIDFRWYRIELLCAYLLM